MISSRNILNRSGSVFERKLIEPNKNSRFVLRLNTTFSQDDTTNIVSNQIKIIIKYNCLVCVADLRLIDLMKVGFDWFGAEHGKRKN